MVSHANLELTVNTNNRNNNDNNDDDIIRGASGSDLPCTERCAVPACQSQLSVAWLGIELFTLCCNRFAGGSKEEEGHSSSTPDAQPLPRLPSLTSGRPKPARYSRSASVVRNFTPFVTSFSCPRTCNMSHENKPTVILPLGSLSERPCSGFVVDCCAGSSPERCVLLFPYASAQGSPDKHLLD